MPMEPLKCKKAVKNRPIEQVKYLDNFNWSYLTSSMSIMKMTISEETIKLPTIKCHVRRAVTLLLRYLI